MRWTLLIALAGLLAAPAAWAQESYKVEVLKEGPPAAVAAAIKGELAVQGYRVVDGQGKGLAEFWIRKAVPGTAKPAGPNGPILYPFLQEGELLGALRYTGEGHDYRDQAIAQGVYTLRYGLQPLNGDHLGVSPYRDFALLLPAAKDTTLAVPPKKKLEEQSAESAGTSHPAVLMMLPVPDSAARGEPAMIHDEEKNTWGATVPLSVASKGASAPVVVPIQLVVVGAAMP